MTANLRVRAQVFLDLANQLDHEHGSPVEATRLRRLAQDLINQAEDAERNRESGAPVTEEKPSIRLLPAANSDQP